MDIQEAIDEFKDVFGVEQVAIVTDEELKRRTLAQNNAMHKYFRDLAGELAANGVDVREFKNPIAPTEEIVKQYMWKPVMEAYTNGKKTHTAELTTREVTAIYEILNRMLADRFGVHVPFPNYEDML